MLRHPITFHASPPFISRPQSFRRIRETNAKATIQTLHLEAACIKSPVPLRFCHPPGQRDLLVHAAPAGGLHLLELRQQLPVAAVGAGARHRGVLRPLPVQDVEPGRAAAVDAAPPSAPETGAADQQQPALPDPPQLGATEIRGLCR